MNRYILSDDFLKKITDISAGFLLPEIHDRFISLIETEIRSRFFTFSSESNLLRIISNMYDKRAFIADSVKYPHYVEILTAIAANSNYLTDILVRNPEYFYRIVNPSYLQKPLKKPDLLKELDSTLSGFKTLSAKVNALRSIKRREILRTGLKDILKMSGMNEVTGELSVLAECLSASLFNLCWAEVLNKYKIENISSSFCIIALGKLGGNELNYSSDIDLIIFYERDQRAGKKEYKELLTEAALLFIEQSSSITSGGYLYRVDFRLRPDGRQSPLCGPVNDYLNYYESRGEDWERQMLLKASFLAGDENLYNRFISYLQPFIYPSSFRVSPVEQIRKLKRNIEYALKDPQDIKLAPGGIRDIEFTVQVLQLINGHKNKSIRTGNTLKAVDALASAGLLTAAEKNILESSYLLYREIEHYLQLMNDLQTHTVPREGELLSKMSAFLGYKKSSAFLKDLSGWKEKVGKIFESVTDPAQKEKTKPEAEIKYNNPPKAGKNLDYLREGIGLLGAREFDLQTINAFRKIEPALMEYLSRALRPDLVLQNFVRIIRNAGLPSIWYKAFEDKNFFNSFLAICEFSQKAVDLFAEDKELHEFYLSGEVFKPEYQAKGFTTRRLLFYLSVQLCLKLVTPERFSEILCSYFTEKIRMHAGDKLKRKDYLIAAMGSFGTGEMNFASDIDLIIAVNETDKKENLQKDFISFLKLLREEFRPFETDCRLRPEGKSSQLVWDIKSYSAYIAKRARVWELQAFTKLRFVSGNKKLFDTLIKSLHKRIKSEDCSSIRREIRDMRKKLYPADVTGLTKAFNIKRSAGGMTDIEFLVQYFILCYPELFLQSTGKETSAVISFLKNKISEEEQTLLTGSYNFLRSADLFNQNIFNSTTHIMSEEPGNASVISAFAGYNSVNDYNSSLKAAVRKVKQIYDKYLAD